MFWSLGTWSSWYTVYCYVEKSRLINGSVKVFRYNISSLEECDRIDSNYVSNKANRIINETDAKVETIKKELNIKLDQIEKEKAIEIKAATSFTLLAILMICLVFLINILIDFQKLICYLKKYYCLKKILNKVTPEKAENSSSNEQKSVFIQVVEQKMNHSYHAYFQKRKLKLKEWVKKRLNKETPQKPEILSSNEKKPWRYFFNSLNILLFIVVKKSQV